MVTLLRKLFIKDYQNVNNKEVRKKHGNLAAGCGVFFNLFLFGFKLFIGLITASLSIISDAINNLSDLLSCVVNLVGFNLASKKADSKHPYGHERIEYIAGMIVSFIIICVGGILAYSSITKLISGESDTTYSLVAFIILGVSILAKMGLGLIYRGIGKAIDSVSLKASMQDSFNDCISTSVVLVAAIIQYYFNNLWWLDSAMSIAVAVFIIISGIKMVKETSEPLVGLSPDSEKIKTIVNDIKSHEGVMGVHDVVVHSYGPTKLFVTLHCEVDGYGNMFEIHEMIDEIEKHMGAKYGLELTIHMDPIDTKNKELPLIKEKLQEIINSIDSRITFHDLRMTAGKKNQNILFDIVLPSDKDINVKDIVVSIRKQLIEYKPSYNPVITVDTNYIGE